MCANRVSRVSPEGTSYLPVLEEVGNAASRVWTILALTLLGREVPEEIPEAWRDRWQANLGKPLSRTLHDTEKPFDPIPRRPEMERQNRAQVERLMDAVARLWL